MNERSYKENGYFQAATNLKKLGAYYTDLDHCRRIGNLFDFDTADEICVLEPSMGDGSAVLTVTGGRPNCKIYGVEIQPDTYKAYLEDNKNFTAVLNEDFLRGVKISHGVFSFVFANPPYGEIEDAMEKKRLEQQFLEKISWYMKPSGFLALVIPYPVFTKENFFRFVMARYEICSYFRFDDKEFNKFNQILVVLKKKRSSQTGYLRAAFEKQYADASDIKSYPYLPDSASMKYTICDSYDSDIEYFTSTEFKPEEAVKSLGCSPLFITVGEAIFQKEYRGCDLNQPIVPVSNDMAYLLAVSGGGQGLAGDEAEGTLHLQRGVAKRVEEDKLKTDEKGRATSIVSTSYTKIRMNIIENDGRITQL